MSKLIALIRDRKIYFKCKKKQFVYEFTDINTYPNVPFYHSIYDKDEIEKFSEFYKKNIASFFNLVKRNIHILLPPDGIEVDEMLLKSFFLDTNLFANVIFINETICLSKQKTYVAISATERMMVVDYFRDGELQAQKCHYILAYSKKELLQIVKDVHEDCYAIQMPIVLNGSSLSIYEELGILTNIGNILDNAEQILKKK